MVHHVFRFHRLLCAATACEGTESCTISLCTGLFSLCDRYSMSRYVRAKFLVGLGPAFMHKHARLIVDMFVVIQPTFSTLRSCNCIILGTILWISFPVRLRGKHRCPQLMFCGLSAARTLERAGCFGWDSCIHLVTQFPLQWLFRMLHCTRQLEALPNFTLCRRLFGEQHKGQLPFLLHLCPSTIVGFFNPTG